MIFSNVLVGIAVMTARFVMWLSVRATEATDPMHRAPQTSSRKQALTAAGPATPNQWTLPKWSTHLLLSHARLAHAATHSRVAPIARWSSSASSAWVGSTSA